MKNRGKIIFWTILVLIIMNCGVVFADASNDFDYVIQNNIPSFYNTEYYTEASNALIGYENLVVISRYYFTFPGSEGDQVTNRIYYTQYYIYGSNNLSYFDKSSNNAVVTPPPVMYLYIEFNHNTGYITFRNYGEKTTKQSFQMQNDSKRKIVFSTKDINYYNSSNIYYPATDTYKTPYYEITLNYKGQSSIQANGEKVKAYTYDSIYDTGITTIGNKFLKLGYLYIDDNYTISNLLTSIPIMTKYSMNLLNNWEYTLFEGVYTTGEKENGFLKYEIRIPIEYVSTPNYYNIFFRSRDKEIQEDINIDFVLLNNKENSGSIGPIITPSGDILSGDYTQDNTTLGDINNSIGEINQTIKDTIGNIEFNESGDVIESSGMMGGIWDMISNFFGWIWDFLFRLDEEQLKILLDQIQAQMEETHSLLSVPLHILNESLSIFINANPQDFILSWEDIEFQSITLIKAGSFNINEFVNSNDKLKEIYDIYIIIISAGWIYLFANWLRALYLDILSIEWLGNKVEEEIIIEEERNYRIYENDKETAMTHNNKTGMTEHNPRRRVVHYGTKGKDYWVE